MLTCSNFIDEGIIDETFSKDKKFQLGEVDDNLQKRVIELEIKMTPNKHVEVLESWWNAVKEAMPKI